MSETLELRKICDLKVPELRSELEKRDLDKTGVKAILLERLQKALLDEGENPENYVFDKYETLISEKKLSPVTEKKETKSVTPTKTIKTNFVGRRPGPKSKTCAPQLKIEKAVSSNQRKKIDEVKQEQADSSNVAVITEDSKKEALNTSNSDVTDSNEAEAKEIDADEVELIDPEDVEADLCHANETPVTDDPTNGSNFKENTKELEKDDRVKVNAMNTVDIKISDDLKGEGTDLKQCLDSLDTSEEVKGESSENNQDDKKENINGNSVIRVKEVIPLVIDEDNIQDEELDHEVDEEEIKGSTDDFNEINDTEKSIQENNKDDNNEDSINLTIGEDDIKLFADEEDTNIEKEDEVTENCSKEETSLIKQRESRHPITANSSRSTTGSVKSRRSTTEKRSSVGDKPRSGHKEDKDNSNAKPIISVSVPKDEKKEEEKQVKDKVETGNKQSTDSKSPQVPNDTTKKNNASLVRNIWVSGLSSITKATDLKQLFSKYGKVVGAKVVTNAKTPGARCYGFVTLSSAEDANRSIENLHKTELHGRVISVERAKRDNGYQQTTKSSDVSKISENSEAERKNKKPEEKKDKREEKREKRPEITINDVEKKPDVPKDQKRSLSKDQGQETKRSKIVIERDDRKKDRSIKSKSNERDRERLRELERERERLEREKRRQQEILNFTKMKTERERQKQKEQERAMREEERKRRIEKERQLEIERKQKEEAIRLEKERQKLRIERERIEKEKAELLRLERENQRLERERLQREKEELRRAQEKLEETKRQAVLKRAMPPSPPPPSKRHSSNSSRYDERKEPVRSSRVQPSTDYISQAAPPPPNITSSRHRYEQHSSDSRRSRPSPPPPPPPASRPKDSTVSMRYGAPPSADHHYRSRDDRSDRREDSRRKESSNSGSSSRHAHTSYDSNKSSYGMSSRNNESNTWSSAPVKSSYSSLGSNSGSSSMVMNARPDPWSNSSSREIETNVWQQRPPQPPTDNRWNSTSNNPSSMSISGRSSSSNPLYVNNHQVIPNMGLNMSSNYSSDNRFDSYKMSGMSRKY